MMVLRKGSFTITVRQFGRETRAKVAISSCLILSTLFGHGSAVHVGQDYDYISHCLRLDAVFSDPDFLRRSLQLGSVGP